MIKLPINMASPDLFELAQREPESLSPQQRLVCGLAFIAGATSPEATNLEPSSRTQMLHYAIAITNEALQAIRTDPQLSEPDKFRAGLMAIREIKWSEVEKMEPTPLLARLTAESILTLAAGQATFIRERIAQLQEGIDDNFYACAAIMTLGDKRKGMTPVEQIVALQNSTLGTPDQRKDLAAAWARRLAVEADDKQFGDMVRHFSGQQDMEIFAELTGAKLKQVLVGKPTTAQ